MPHILKNDILEIHIDFPEENYKASRFDWSGKITQVMVNDIKLFTDENPSANNQHLLGKGMFNEFGIDKAIGFDETKMGEWFHKIGVGLLKKENSVYNFRYNYQIKPINFDYQFDSQSISYKCKSPIVNGYGYILSKEIKFVNDFVTINYHLKNTGEKEIKTTEYVHNFLDFNNTTKASEYILKFPFKIIPSEFIETVNPENAVDIGTSKISFNSSPKEQFFFSNLSGYENVPAEWTLFNSKNSIEITEQGNFSSNTINLWGWNHVICPELFFNISVLPNESASWSRAFHFKKK